MIWFILSLCAAVSEGAKDIFHSQPKVKPILPAYKAWAITAWSLLFLTPAFLAIHFVWGTPALKPGFWLYVTIHAVLLSVAFVLYMYALQRGKQWQTQPLLALTVPFMMITTPLMTTDRLTVWALVSLGLVTVGLYGAGYPGPIKDPKTGEMIEPGVFDPFVNMFRGNPGDSAQERRDSVAGVWAKIGVAGIFSVTANLDKLCVDRSSPFLYLVIDQLIVSLMLGGVLLFVWAMQKFQLLTWAKFLHMPFEGPPIEDPKTKKPIPVAKKRYLFIGGLINACTVGFHMFALTFVAAPYVISVKRISIFVVSMWDYKVRKSRKLHWLNIAGLIVVLSGIALMMVYGRTAGKG